MPHLIPRRRRGRLGSVFSYLLISVAALLAAALVSLLSDDNPFDRFFAGLPPLAVIGGTAIVGGLSLRLLSNAGWSIGLPAGWRPYVAALAFALVAIAVDLSLPFPEDTNVSWPTSLLFYPAVGFQAEVFFHVVPVAAIVGLTRWQLLATDNDRRVWLIILAVALAEAVFQVAAALTNGSDGRLVIFVAIHLFAIGLVELTMFRQHGFGSIMIFRLTYYMLWHVIWGHLRLSVLF